MKRFSMGLPRLYFRFYVALLFILVLFAFAVVMIWNRTGSPLERSNNTLAQVMQNVLAPIDAPPEVQPFFYAQPEAGAVFLWESWLRHEVTANGAKSERISVSFNYR